MILRPEPEKKPAKKEASSKADDKKEASTGSAQTPAVQLSDLQNILSNMAGSSS